jgi:hypothetical protein
MARTRTATHSLCNAPSGARALGALTPQGVEPLCRSAPRGRGSRSRGSSKIVKARRLVSRDLFSVLGRVQRERLLHEVSMSVMSTRGGHVGRRVPRSRSSDRRAHLSSPAVARHLENSSLTRPPSCLRLIVEAGPRSRGPLPGPKSGPPPIPARPRRKVRAAKACSPDRIRITLIGAEPILETGCPKERQWSARSHLNS